MKLLPEKTINFSAILIFCVFVFITNIFADSVIPLPSGAILVKENDLGTKLQQAKVGVYKISASVDKVGNFFSKEMKNAGWEGEKQRDGSFMFKNDQEIVMVVIVPPRKPGSSTMFSVTRSSKISKDQLYASKKDKPDKLSFMPLYPKSQQQFLMDLPHNGVSASYSTGDSINDVVFFYKAQMLNYRWTLASETPVAEKEIDCPECNKNQVVKDKVFMGQEPKGRSSTASLTFRRSSGEVCIIRIFSSRLSNVLPEISGINDRNTTILVTYNEKTLSI